MPPLTENNTFVTKIKDDISELQKDVAKFGVLVDRLDIAIDKLTEFSNNVSKLIAVHETKLNFQQQGHEDVVQKIEDLKKDCTKHHDQLETSITTIETRLAGRITTLEKWMWLVMGGSVVAGIVFQLLTQIILQ
jgi:DNA repair exonuclease SbcCD ATPase subunit